MTNELVEDKQAQDDNKDGGLCVGGKIMLGKTETGCGRGYRRVRFPGGRRGL